MHRLRSYDLSASYADPKPWMEFSERTPAAEAGCPPVILRIRIFATSGVTSGIEDAENGKLPFARSDNALQDGLGFRADQL
jgi:hypothetical protein